MLPDEAEAEFAAWTTPWWVSGGWAIDLAVGHQSREHADLDILVLRRDHRQVRARLRD